MHITSAQNVIHLESTYMGRSNWTEDGSKLEQFLKDSELSYLQNSMFTLCKNIQRTMVLFFYYICTSVIRLSEALILKMRVFSESGE